MFISKDVQDYLIAHLESRISEFDLAIDLRGPDGPLPQYSEARALYVRARNEILECAGRPVEVGKTYKYEYGDGSGSVQYLVTDVSERSYKIIYQNGSTSAIQMGSPINFGSVEVTDKEDLRLSGNVKFSPPGVPFTIVDWADHDGVTISGLLIRIPNDEMIYHIPKWQRFIPHVVIDDNNTAKIGDVVKFAARAKHFGIDVMVPKGPLAVSNTRTFRKHRRSYVRQVELVMMPRHWFDISAFETYAGIPATIRYRDFPAGPTVPTFAR